MNFEWPNGKTAALSLTFDDARPTQLDNCLPILEKAGVKGTFYVSLLNVERRLIEWQSLAKRGHAIGNHTATHPCCGSYNFSRHNALEDYTVQKMRNDIIVANEKIHDWFHFYPTTFAYPCGQTVVGRGTTAKSYVKVIAEIFHTGRGWYDEDANDPTICDLAKLLSMLSDGRSLAAMKVIVDNSIRDKKWLILTGHNVGTGTPNSTSPGVMHDIIQYALSSKVWIGKVDEIGNYIRTKRGF